jgi:molybdopterin converting factor small subunit
MSSCSATASIESVRVRLFAILREPAGSDSVEIDLADGATVADALRALS